MDPIAHTLTGVALAQTGLRRKTPYATGALLIGANLPDIDGISQLWGGDASLCWRRGWTHGTLAMVVLPLALAAVLALFHRLRRPERPQPGFLPLAALSYLALLTHPALDWLNNYGVRLLMPFDGRWFYGDTLFIVDPWIWLILGGSVLLGWPRTRMGVVLWAVAFAAATTLILTAVNGLWPAKLLWLAALVALGGLKMRGASNGEDRTRLWAKAGLTVFALYIAVMLGTARYARAAATEELARRGIHWDKLMVGPTPVTPFRKDVVVSTPEGYRYGAFDFFRNPRLTLADRILPKPDDSPILQEALRSPEIRGLVNWARFPFVEIDQQGDRYEVYVTDARFSRTRGASFGSAKVIVKKPLTQ